MLNGFNPIVIHHLQGRSLSGEIGNGLAWGKDLLFSRLFCQEMGGGYIVSPLGVCVLRCEYV